MTVELQRAVAWLVGGLVAFSLASSQARADDGRANTASGQLATKPAALKSSAKPIGVSNPSHIMIEQVRVSKADQKTQVRVEGNGGLSYLPSRLSRPERLVLDFSGALVHMQQKLIPSNLAPVLAVRVGQFKDDVARVVIELDGVVSYTIHAEGNAVTVLFESSAVVGSRAAAPKETLVAVNAAPADLSPSSFADRKETDMERMSSPVPATPPEAVPRGPAIAQVKPSESILAEGRPAGLQTSPPPAPPPLPESDRTVGATGQPGKDRSEPISVPSDDDYTIGLQDVLAISVWREPELSRSVRVRPDGKISLPLVGEVKASGLTTLLLKTQIAKELEAYIQNPEVTVSVQEVNSHRFSIIGEIQRPGSYLLTKPMTVLDAIAVAGGFREFAKLKKIYVMRRVLTRANGTVPYEDVRIFVNYKEVINGEHPEQNVELEPGDTIVVP